MTRFGSVLEAHRVAIVMNRKAGKWTDEHWRNITSAFDAFCAPGSGNVLLPFHSWDEFTHSAKPALSDFFSSSFNSSNSEAKPPMVLIAGGDGTTGSVLGQLSHMPSYLQARYRPPPVLQSTNGSSTIHEADFPPPCVPIALGSECMFALQWGWKRPGITGESFSFYNLMNKLDGVFLPKMLDVWRTTSTTQYHAGSKPNDTNSPKSDENTLSEVPANAEHAASFVVIGYDSEVLLLNELIKRRFPRLTNHLRTTVGLTAAAYERLKKPSEYNLHRIIRRLDIDGHSIPIPVGLNSLILINHASYGQGKRMWVSPSSFNNAWVAQRVNDGKLEVTGFRSTIIGLLTRPFMLGQGSHIRVEFDTNCSEWQAKPVAFQSDGEPYRLWRPETFEVSRRGQVSILRNLLHSKG
jgi:hypothetical protein